MSRSVTVITAQEIYRYKMAYHGDKFLHIGAVTIVNNTDHTLHYASEKGIAIPNFLKQLCSRLLRRAVVIISKDLFVYKRKNCALYCMVSTFRP